MKTKTAKGFTPLEKVIDFHWRKLQGLNSLSLKPVRKRNSLTGFTLVELLIVLAIISLMLGVLMPALTQIRKIAANTKQKAQISSIEIGLSLYKNDFGQYPPSHGFDPNNPTDPNYDYNYNGAQTLAEAMFGIDLLGMHSDSAFIGNGKDIGNTRDLYPPDPNTTNLSKRKGPYLDRTNIGVFKPEDIYKTPPSPAFPASFRKWRYVICDVFSVKSKEIGNKRYKIGTPILYFRANLSPINTRLVPNMIPGRLAKNIYNYADNYFLMNVGRIVDGKNHPICPFDDNPTDAGNGNAFYKYIHDPMILPASGTWGRPVRPDSFLLISAGFDGLYGTNDDICNFEPNIE
ncbi:MAG: hypothetical protein CVV39_07240 [Planctomycetes bacterium HGW-Planctomycetes-1]|nr:MAG: hypothetical protein CVV39_07240 [Planctomycetes bacterium HGW-Planctomycetes-1]